MKGNITSLDVGIWDLITICNINIRITTIIGVII
jgi:hypothetical protein